MLAVPETVDDSNNGSFSKTMMMLCGPQNVALIGVNVAEKSG